MTTGRSGCRRPNASSCDASFEPRSTAVIAFATRSRVHSSRECRLSSNSRLPRKICSTLLKSCATPARQFADRLHLLRLEQRLARVLQHPAGFHTLGDVTRDFRKADQRPIFVTDCIDHHVRPEAPAVLSHPPPFGFEPSLTGCDRQSPLRQVGRGILGCVEARHVRADDFLGAIPVDPASAGVPVRDDPGGRKHENRVVRHSVHEHAKAPFALDDGIVRGLLVRHVAHDLAEAEHTPCVVGQSGDHDIGPEP
ncbi:hypothetical protein QF001_003866 [Paraburkholderia youngii]